MNYSLLAICLMIVLLSFYCLYGLICYKKHNKIIPMNNININFSNIDNKNGLNKENELNNINIYNV